MSHRNARLTPTGRRIMIERIAAGTPQAHVAEQMGVSRATVSKRSRRWLAEGDAGLEDRSSRPRRSPKRTSKRVEERACRLRRSKRRGPRMISMHTGVPASTGHKILVRRDLNRLAWIDRPTGRVIRRYERDHPGELIHLDIKKAGKIPPGGGWRVRGRGQTKTRRVGTRTCPQRSTTTPGSPMSKPMTARRPKRSSGSGAEPRGGSGPKA